MNWRWLRFIPLLMISVALAQSNGINGNGPNGGPGGSPNQIQYNQNGSLGGIPNGSSSQVLESNGASALPSFQTLPLPLKGVSASIGGTALTAGTCTSGTVNITGVTTSMVAVVNPTTYPGDGAEWEAYVSAAGVVTIKVCALVALTPIASTYDVRVIQ